MALEHIDLILMSKSRERRKFWILEVIPTLF